MTLGSKGPRPFLFRLVARGLALALFLGPLRLSAAAAAAAGPAGRAPTPAAGAGAGGDHGSRPGKLPTDTPGTLGQRLRPSRIELVDGPTFGATTAVAGAAALERLFDDRAGTGLETAGQPARFRVHLARPAHLEAIGVFGRAAGTLSASVEGPSGRVDVLRGVDLARGGEDGRWSRQELTVRAPARVILMEWRPARADAVLSELELWGRPAPGGGEGPASLPSSPSPGRRAPAPPLPDLLHTTVPAGAAEVRAPEPELTIAPAGAPGAGTFTLALTAAPRAPARAFLVYDLAGLPHFTAARRSVNGLAARGGFAATFGAKGGLQVEEISPSWLRAGKNSVQFLPADDRNPASYRVSGVRLVIVDAADGGPSDATARDWGALRDGREATGWNVDPGQEPARHDWTYDAPTQPRALELRLARAGAGKLTVAAIAAPSPTPASGAEAGSSSAEVTVQLDDLAAGWHRVPLDKLPPTMRLSVTVTAGREKAVALSELGIAGSPVPADAAPRLAVTYPLSGECVGHRVHLRGFIDPPGPAALTVNGAVPRAPGALSSDGAFAVEMTDKEAGAEPGKPFSVALEVAYAAGGGGARVRRTVPLGACVDRPPPVVADDGRPRQPKEDLGAPYGATVKAGEAAHLAFAGLALDIPAGAVDKDVRITVRPLPAKHVAKLDSGMTNITPAGQAFRLGPLGMVFKKPVKITVPYDRKLVPAGYSMADARTFFYDESLARWEQVGLVDERGDDHGGQFVAVTEHFTDFINATLAMPDHPGTRSFNPTSIKDLKLGDPAAGIAAMLPPEPNNMGTANLSFPIEVPPGRRGLQPNLAITYSSGAGNSWLGVGWDLKVSSIEIDTRFGVPRYAGEERYLLDGEALTPIDTPSAPAPQEGKYFARRVEGKFERIRRLGSTPSGLGAYTWEITDKDGTKYRYGTGFCPNGPCARLGNPEPPNQVFRWDLNEVEDTFGNKMLLSYAPDHQTGGDFFVQNYLLSIVYTVPPGGTGASYGVYFDRELDRPDAFSTARPGFQVKTRHLLKKIRVQLDSEIIRQYDLTYKDGDFGKKVLEAISMRGLGAHHKLYEYKLTYYRGLTSDETTFEFDVARPWGTISKASGGSSAPRPEHALSQLDSNYDAGGISFGIGIQGLLGLSVDFGFGTGGGETTGLRHIDINGDGLPDFLDPSAGANLSQVSVNPSTLADPEGITNQYRFLSPLQVAAATPHHASRDGWDFEAKWTVFPVTENLFDGYSLIATEDDREMADMDGDGFADQVSVKDFVVSVRKNNRDGTFGEEQPWGTPPHSPSSLEPPEWGTPESQAGSFPTNTLIRWTAPYTGEVRLVGNITKPNQGGDGVHMSAHWFAGAKGSSRQLLWEETIPGNFPGASAGPAAQFTVAAGDRVYLMVDGLGTTEADDINWDPTIRYVALDNQRLEPYGAPIFRFSQKDDFAFDGQPEMRWTANATGDLELFMFIRKDTTPDDVQVRLVKVAPGNRQVLGVVSLQAAQVVTQLFSTDIPDAVKGDQFILEVVSDTMIDPRRVMLVNPDLEYDVGGEFCRERGGDPPKCGVLQCAQPGHVGCHVEGDNVILPRSALTRRIEPSYRLATPMVESTSPTQTVVVPNGAAPTAHIGGVAACANNPNAAAIVLVQGVNRLIGKWFLGPNDVQFLNLDVPVQAGEQLFFTTVRQAGAGAGDCAFSPTLSFQPGVIQTPPVNVRARTSSPAAEPMAGGYHNWWVGDWNGNFPFDAPGDENQIKPPQPTDPANSTFMFCIPRSEDDDPEGLTPQQRIWHCRGRDGYIKPGAMKPSRQLMASSLRQTLRLAKTTSAKTGRTYSIILAGTTGEVHWGQTKTTMELMDMNGDLYADSLSAGSIAYNTGSGGFVILNGGNGGGTLRTLNHWSFVRSGFLKDGGLIAHKVSKGRIPAGLITTTASLGSACSVSSTATDLADINGDGLPDRVRKNPGDGKLFVRLNYGYSFATNEVEWPSPQWQLNNIAQLGFYNEGFDQHPELGQEVSTRALSLHQNVSTNLTGGLDFLDAGVTAGDVLNTTLAGVEMLDINGDGLPDHVMKKPGEAGIRVKFNLGAGFASEVQLQIPPGWAGLDVDDLGIFNLPHELLAARTSDGISFERSEGWQTSVSYGVCWGPLGILCLSGSKFSSSETGWMQSKFEDIDGDGAADQVLRLDGNALVLAKRSLIKKSNLLAVVEMPLGGRIELDYDRRGNVLTTASAGDVLSLPNESLKVDMPRMHWVLSKVTVKDGRVGTYTDVVDYDFLNADPASTARIPSGFYDRDEREDYGFSHVRITRGVKSPATGLFVEGDGSRIERFYHNDDFYLRGHVAEEYEIALDQNQQYRDTLVRGIKNTYDPVAIAEKSVFPREKDRTTLLYEDLALTPQLFATILASPTGAAPKYRKETRTFNPEPPASGGLVRLVDEGDEQLGTDNLQYDVGYANDPVRYIVKPNLVTARVVGSSTLLRERRSTYQPATGALATLTDVVTGGKVPATGATYNNAPATWTFTYNTFGNLETVRDPNAYVLTYGYDALQIYRTSVTDSFGYVSRSVPHVHFGVDREIIDVNGQKTTFEYDLFGRLGSVRSPLDQGSNETIRFTYSQQAEQLGPDGEPIPQPFPAWASTEHKDVQAPVSSDRIQIVTFIDGMRRVIQTKKDLSRDALGNGVVAQVRSISGERVLDERGRLRFQGEPFFEPLSAPATELAIIGMGATTGFAHDTLGRLRTTILPDGAPTHIFYSVQANALSDGRTWMRTHTLDAEGKRRDSYSDSSGDPVAVRESNVINGVPTSLLTRYEHDAVGQLVQVTDARGNVTTSDYDTVGRMVALTSPDAGRTEYRYDLAGNLKAKETPVLRAQGRLIRYEHDFNRLRKIDYPTMPDVTYVYGGPAEGGDASGNRAGRVKTVTMEGGSETRFYDRLGNVKEARTTLAHMAEPGRPSVTFTMKYSYDSFGRMLDMTFPNWIDSNFQFVQGEGEKITYTYDRGGNLDKITGHHQTLNPQQQSHPTDFDYVRHVGYDKFGQRTVLVSGNGIANRFTYDGLTRRLTDVDADARGDIEQQQSRPPTPFHRLHYTYDRVGNVKTLENRVSLQPWRNAAVNIGPLRIDYTYDDLYQLKSMTAKYRSRAHEGYQYSDGFTYDEIGNFKRKAQSIDRLVWDNQNVTPTTDPVQAMAQLDGSRFDHNIAGLSYTFDYQYTGPRPHAASSITETRPGGAGQARPFTYDADGNNTGNTFQGATRTQIWDEEDRLKEVRNGGTTAAKFRYNDDGERTKKQAPGVGDSWYVNQFYSLLANGRPTKHIFAGETRVASKTDALWMQTPVLHHYHPDHLGTTSYVSDQRQNLVQHERYFAFGELWRDPGGPQEETDLSRPNGDRKEWLFTGKEWDVETNLYYFGARYLDPRTGVWQSTDPLLAAYVAGRPNLGVHHPANLSLYSYSFNNPVVSRDPDGEAAAAALGAPFVVAGAAVAACLASVVCAVVSAAAIATFLGGRVDALRPPQIADIPPPLPAPAIPPSRATAPNAPTDHLIHKDGEVTTDDGPTINEAGRGTKANPATSEDVLTEQLGRKPRKQEIENYEQQLQLEAAQTGHAPRPKQKAAQQKALPTEHTKNKSRSKADRHFKGRARAKKDAGAEKGDARRRPKIK